MVGRILLWGLLLVVVGSMLLPIGTPVLRHVGTWAQYQVHPTLMAAVGRILRRVLAGVAPGGLEIYALADRGKSAAAGAAVDRLLAAAREVTPAVCPWAVINCAADVLVNAGRYAAARDAPAGWPAEAQEAGRQRAPDDHRYVQVNIAEALHNLGDDEAALARLEPIEAASAPSSLLGAGCRLLHAWILAQRGEAEAARALATGLPEAVFGPRYRAELHYTWAAIERAAGRLDEAERRARRGLACARRAASRRNGWHALGAVALARGDLTAAIAHLEVFARHPYRGQSAPGLLALGEAYERAGRPADAQRAFRRALEEDPESSAAAIARGRVG